MVGMPDPPWCDFLPTAQILQQRKPSLASPSMCICVPLECSEQQPTSLLPAPTLLDWCCHNSSDEPSAVEVTQCVPLECSEQQPITSLSPAPTLLDWCCHNCSEEPFVAKVQFVAVAKPCLVCRECCLGRPHSVSVHRFVCLRSSPLSDWTILKDVTHSADAVLNSVTQLELVLSPTCILLDGFMLSQLFSECISSLCVRW
jgi:hypothetical protein